MAIIVAGLSYVDLHIRTYELYYRTGGHVGPFATFFDALEGADARVNETDTYLDAVDRKTGKVVARIRHNAEGDLVATPPASGYKNYKIVQTSPCT